MPPRREVPLRVPDLSQQLGTSTQAVRTHPDIGLTTTLLQLADLYKTFTRL
jgi:predicted ArsR family transcriptional regulator